MNNLWKRFFGKRSFGPMLHGSPIIHLDLPITKVPNTDKKEERNKTEAESTEAQAKVAIEAERKRIAEIDEIAILYDAETIYQAKYGENPCTAAEMAFAAAKRSAMKGQSFVKALMDDFKTSGAADVAATYALEDGDRKATPQEHMVQGSNHAKMAQKTE